MIECTWSNVNLIVLSFFHSMFLYDPHMNAYREQDTTDPFYSGEDWMKSFNEKFHSDIQQLRKDFLDIFPSSDIMIKLSFLILIFSNRVSLNEANQYSTVKAQSLSIFNAQNVFVDLLYKYYLNQFGTSSAPVVFARYVSKVMKLQAADRWDQIHHTGLCWCQTTISIDEKPSPMTSDMNRIGFCVVFITHF